MLLLWKQCIMFLLFFFVGWSQAPVWAVNAPVAPSVLLTDPQKISLDCTDASLPTVLKSLAYSHNLNIVIGKDVTGKVSAQLKNISLDNALNAILNINGYGFYRKENIVFIVPQGERECSTESFQLSYLFAKDSKTLLSKVLSDKGDIQVNEATNSLVVMDYPENIAKIKKLISGVDQAPLQVLIEAKIVDIKTSDVEKIGTAWNSPVDTDIDTATRGLSAGSALKDTDGAMIKFLPRFKSLSANLSIDALVQESKAHILASPSIATLSGLEARIIIGDRIPYKSSTNSITSGTSTGTTTNSVIEFVEVGTTLKVTPLVSPDGWITMKVHPEVSSVVAMIPDAGPQITTREADATIRVKDNETIIIGGLIGKNKDSSDNGVPWLSKVPGMGWLFKRHSLSESQSELMVFITPHIIRLPPDQQVMSKSEKPEVRVETQSLGHDPSLLKGYFSYAEDLEALAVKKPEEAFYYRMELIKVYKMIVQQFPLSGKVDYCLFKIAYIYVSEFGKCEPAKESLLKLHQRFPESPYIGQIKTLLNACLDRVGRKQR